MSVLDDMVTGLFSLVPLEVVHAMATRDDTEVKRR
jgi:hypothetical protein